jgi:acetyl esterase/lipase
MIHRYGDHPSQHGELLIPADEPRGVVVVIHGGFWKVAYGLEWGRPLAVDLASRGWVSWNLEYRRVGDGGGVPATVDDVAAGMDLLADLGLDLSTVVTVGHSAGGHLATWAASRGGVTAVISQAGVLDLRSAYADGLGGGAVEALLGHAPSDADDVLDPLRQVPLDVPVWCVHAPDDDTVPISQSRDYVAAAEAAGGRATLVEVPGDHYSVIDPASDAWALTVGILEQL